MTTNREWLYSLEPDELTAWFDAQRVDANDVSTRKGDVRADGVCANDVDVLQDSREKLEADLRRILHSAYMLAWMHGNENRRGSSFKKLHVEFYNLLDRQAAITEREVLAHPDERDEQIAELTAQVDELSQQLTSARADCEQYRELFSKAITQAAEIVNLQP